MKKFCHVLLCATGFWSSAAFGFSLSDHTQITAQAIREFNTCFPNTISEMAAQRIDEYNLNEDTNLLNKWLFYSHYYHPYKELDMMRYQSPVRVEKLETELRDAEASGTPAMDDAVLDSFSHALHHIQDMASPPHVTPVTHWLTDGFEKYELPLETSRAMTSDDCMSLITRPRESLLDILKDVARTTLDLLRSEKISVEKNGARAMIAWSAFWEESSDNSFGDYGIFGNTYGESSVNAGGDRYQVSQSVYRVYKMRQLRLAVEATKRALRAFTKSAN